MVPTSSPKWRRLVVHESARSPREGRMRPAARHAAFSLVLGLNIISSCRSDPTRVTSTVVDSAGIAVVTNVTPPSTAASRLWLDTGPAPPDRGPAGGEHH